MDLVVSLSLSMIGSSTVRQIMHPKNKIIMKSHTMKLLFLVAIIHILFISTNIAVGLDLNKTANTDFAFFDDIIEYNYVLKNDEGVDLHDVVFNDDHFGSIAIGNLSSGSTWTHSLSHTVIASDFPGPLKNAAWATGKRPDGSSVRSPNATWEVSLTLSGFLEVTVRPIPSTPRPIGSTFIY
ncbi:MAG TPA: hypothetical protein VF300_01435, partial [Methanothrix sp.]